MKQKKKKIYKKIIISVTSILMVLGLFVINRTEYKALSNVTSSNSFGGYTWQIHDMSIDMSGNATLQSGNISMNLNGHYSGTFTINIHLSTIINTNGVGYTNTINNYGFICNGCIITSYSSTALQIRIVNCNYWEIEIVPMVNATLTNPMPLLNAFDIQSISNWVMTKEDEITASQITTISNYLQSINSNIQTTNSRLTTTNTELHNLNNSIGSAGTYGSITSQLYGIGVNTSELNTKLRTLNNYVTSYLTGTVDNESVSIWDLQNDANYSLSNIETTLSTINSNINDYTNQLNAIKSLLTNIDTNIQDIENQVSVVTWNSIANWTLNGILQSDDTYNNNTITNTNFITINFDTTASSDSNRYPKGIYKIHLPYRLNVNTNQISRYSELEINIRNGYTSPENIYYQFGANGIDLYYQYESYQQSRQLNIDITYPTYSLSIYYLSNDSVSVQYITDNQLEYWNILSAINQYTYNKKLLNAINSINMSVTNTTIQDTQTNITDYNNIYNQVSNVEQTYINEYNTNNTNLQSIINDKKGLPDNIVNVSTDIETKMGQIFQVPEIKYLFALILAGCVLLALLG